MNIARPAYTAPAPVTPDRTRSPRVRARQLERRTARATKLAPVPFNPELLQLELSTVEVAR